MFDKLAYKTCWRQRKSAHNDAIYVNLINASCDTWPADHLTMPPHQPPPGDKVDIKIIKIQIIINVFIISLASNQTSFIVEYAVYIRGANER
ncbi:hypothetical protein [Serratia sp. AKBS12]|uniref:hypothetical protein n=1 Tax=Serratia sp. AKBS12 TaxID=2974597 RepID=UPI002165C3C1|nr:hypothetical protein [Serratia sp. AKBS12]MCS3407113.1 hypothetical protein [Serratia sp. AKBS12]HEI8868876.1 hypothetical protein [Serratia odorifera]